MRSVIAATLVAALILGTLQPCALAIQPGERQVRDRSLELPSSRILTPAASGLDISDISVPEVPPNDADARIELDSLAAGERSIVPAPGPGVAVPAPPEPASLSMPRRPAPESVRGTRARLAPRLQDPFARRADEDPAAESYLYALKKPIVSTVTLGPMAQVFYYTKKFIFTLAKAMGALLLTGSIGALAIPAADLALLPLLTNLQSQAGLQVRNHWDRFKRLRKLGRLDGVYSMKILTSKDIRFRGLVAYHQESRAIVFLETDRLLPEKIPARLLVDPPSPLYIRLRRLAWKAGALEWSPVRKLFQKLGARKAEDFGDPILIEDPSRAKMHLTLELGGKIEQGLPVWESSLRDVLGQTPIPDAVARAWKERVERFEREASEARANRRFLPSFLSKAYAWYLLHFSYVALSQIEVRGTLVQAFGEGAETELPAVLTGKTVTRLLGIGHWDRWVLTDWYNLNRAVRRLLPQRFHVTYAKHVPISHVAVAERMTRAGFLSQLVRRTAGRLIIKDSAALERVLLVLGVLAAGVGLATLPMLVPEGHGLTVLLGAGGLFALAFTLAWAVPKFAARITHRQ